jgi:hypothetical protein
MALGSTGDMRAALGALVDEAPEDLAEAIEKAYAAASPERRRHLSWMLGAMDGRGYATLHGCWKAARPPMARSC